MQIDSVIGHAQEAYTALRYQRTTFGDITSKIGALGNRIPSVRFVAKLWNFFTLAKNRHMLN